MAIAAIKKSVLALACFLALGAYVGLQPSHADETAAPVPEAAQRKVLGDGFPHNQKDHQKIECATCHLGAKEKPVSSDQPMAKDFPHNSCIPCHNFAQEFFRSALGGGSSRFCSICHEKRPISRSDKALKPGVISSKMKEFDDVFGHKQHQETVKDYVRIVPVPSGPHAGYGSQFRVGTRTLCTDCHIPDRNAPLEVKDMQTEMSHPTCFVCHGGTPPGSRPVEATQFPYERDCKVCHDLREGGASAHPITLFGSVKKFRHYIDHDIDIRPKKKPYQPPIEKDFLCAECHKPIQQVVALDRIDLPKSDFCIECHKTNKPGLPDKLADDVLSKLGKRPETR